MNEIMTMYFIHNSDYYLLNYISFVMLLRILKNTPTRFTVDVLKKVMLSTRSCCIVNMKTDQKKMLFIGV